MSRLVDRVLAGCQPFRPSLFYAPDERLAEFRAMVRARPDAPQDDEQVQALAMKAMVKFRSTEPVSTLEFDTERLTHVPVIVGDDVAAYVASLPSGTQMSDVASTMAPPFTEFFVEFQNVRPSPVRGELHAWGALVSGSDDPSTFPWREGDVEQPRWVLTLLSFIEVEEGKPFGPAAVHFVGLAEDGTWFRHSDGSLFWAGGPPGMSPAADDNMIQEWANKVAILACPVLLTISFLHCKNVSLRPVSPEQRTSRRYRKKHGRDLVRYHVLEVDPLRRMLDQHMRGNPGDLRRALHICRGHFKTFTPNAPLLGQHVGTYWWHPQVRGASEHGTVLKDYRVLAPRELGKAYQEADENPPDAYSEPPAPKDPDTAGRGLVAHNRTQNQLASTLMRLGTEPLSPRGDDPEFDLAWKAGEMFYVCEVKSITPTNEERQMRMAIGQVIRYRQKLGGRGHEPITGVVATESMPSDPTWQDLCESEGILLLWPEVAEELLTMRLREVT